MKTFKRYIPVLTVIILLSSCGLFKKKNKCVSCPTWDQVELESEVEIEK